MYRSIVHLHSIIVILMFFSLICDQSYIPAICIFIYFTAFSFFIFHSTDNNPARTNVGKIDRIKVWEFSLYIVPFRSIHFLRQNICFKVIKSKYIFFVYLILHSKE